MPVRRAVVYGYPGSSGIIGLLVLTNDDWNDRMEEVGVVPVRGPVVESADYLYPVISSSPALQAIAGRLLSVDKEGLGHPLVVLADQQLALVENLMCDILALEPLSRAEPERPPVPPGRVDYPLWGEIYYAGEPIDGEHKRWVVVSTDDWNRSSGTSILVRTTSQRRRGGYAFPPIQKGEAMACCGDATTMVARRIGLRGGRPSPERLNTRDMAAIALGLVETHGLRGAVERKRAR